DFLPATDASPYRGVGYTLQVEFDWQDYYGNTLVTTLNSPTADKPPYDQRPIRTGYSDLLIGLAQWPSIASSFEVDTVDGKPTFQLLLTFDASRYEGLLSARMSGSTSVVATFTQPLDPESAQTAVNYTLDSGVVVNATLTDSRTVTLAVAVTV